MATLVLGALGTLIGGPVGGSVGALIGRGIDGSIIGGGSREGPRLKELAITTSSYGQPIARHHGRMRAAGSVIWATDLQENRESEGGGKGRPKTTTYSYSSSFAVALSSRPIERVGRIWADGNLLRGSAGDLKVAGEMRVHTGRGDQKPDPLIAAAEGTACPAFRGCAYAVFENLDLAEFGNRIPALSFEIFADDGAIALADLAAPLAAEIDSAVALPGLAGFSYDGGDFREALQSIAVLFPLSCNASGRQLSLTVPEAAAAQAVHLPEPVTGWNDGDFGAATGYSFERTDAAGATPDALRYYDVARDFQPGLQRGAGRAIEAGTSTLEFPGALSPGTARALIDATHRRVRNLDERLQWRIAELDPALRPGRLVRVPGRRGLWRVTGWEWRERAIELELERWTPGGPFAPPGDAGAPGLPLDLLPVPTLLRAFELPWDGAGDGSSPGVFVAASAAAPSWRGAALYADYEGVLQPVGTTGSRRCVQGRLIEPLAGSPALLFEGDAYAVIELEADDLGFAPTDLHGIAGGANRLLLGSEIVQFADALRIGPCIWRLAGLLRGRGATENAASEGHGAGTPATLLDENLSVVRIDRAGGMAPLTIVAMGRGDATPATAEIEARGASLRPLSPVHPRAREKPDGGIELRWIRRARGAWGWRSEVETPLAEHEERYRVGIGPVTAPLATWEVPESELVIDSATRDALAAAHPGAAVWVRQIGTFAASDPLHLFELS